MRCFTYGSLLWLGLSLGAGCFANHERLSPGAAVAVDAGPPPDARVEVTDPPAGGGCGLRRNWVFSVHPREDCTPVGENSFATVTIQSQGESGEVAVFLSNRCRGPGCSCSLSIGGVVPNSVGVFETPGGVYDVAWNEHALVITDVLGEQPVTWFYAETGHVDAPPTVPLTDARFSLGSELCLEGCDAMYALDVETGGERFSIARGEPQTRAERTYLAVDVTDDTCDPDPVFEATRAIVPW